MKSRLRPLLTSFILFTLLLGFIYPLILTGIAQFVFPDQANGSLIMINKKVIGSKLIGQEFTSDHYFWGRPSSTSGHPYNAYDAQKLTGSSGSNLGPLSKKLMDDISVRVQHLLLTNPGAIDAIPVDLVTSSASGLDPEISLKSAYFQISRIAERRGMSETDLQDLVKKYIQNRQWGILGEPRVNVLLLNLALDGLQ